MAVGQSEPRRSIKGPSSAMCNASVQLCWSIIETIVRRSMFGERRPKRRQRAKRCSCGAFGVHKYRGKFEPGLSWTIWHRWITSWSLPVAMGVCDVGLIIPHSCMKHGAGECQDSADVRKRLEDFFVHQGRLGNICNCFSGAFKPSNSAEDLCRFHDA